MKILHVSHNDLDGVGCSTLVRRSFDDVKTVNLNYGSIDNYLLREHQKYDKIIITDVYPRESTIKKIWSKNKNLVFIDHHPSSINLDKYPFSIRDESRSATSITYEWLLSMGKDLSDYEYMVYLINDYDLWLLEDPMSLDLNTLSNLLENDELISRLVANPFKQFTKEERFIVNVENKRRDKYMRICFLNKRPFIDKDGLNACLLYSEGYTSEVGNHIIQEGGFDYVVLVNMQKGQVSFRSRPDIDVRRLAEANGGGGHKNASGCLIGNNFEFTTILKTLDLVDMII